MGLFNTNRDGKSVRGDAAQKNKRRKGSAVPVDSSEVPDNVDMADLDRRFNLFLDDMNIIETDKREYLLNQSTQSKWDMLEKAKTKGEETTSSDPVILIEQMKGAISRNERRKTVDILNSFKVRSRSVLRIAHLFISLSFSVVFSLPPLSLVELPHLSLVSFVYNIKRAPV